MEVDGRQEQRTECATGLRKGNDFETKNEELRERREDEGSGSGGPKTEGSKWEHKALPRGPPVSGCLKKKTKMEIEK